MFNFCAALFVPSRGFYASNMYPSATLRHRFCPHGKRGSSVFRAQLLPFLTTHYTSIATVNLVKISSLANWYEEGAGAVIAVKEVR